MHKAGFLDESLHYLMDWELWFRFFAVSPPVVIPSILAGYRFHSSAKCVSATNQLALDEVRIHRKIQQSETGELLHIYKELSSARLIKLAEDWIGKAGDLRQFGPKALLREFGSRMLEKVKPAPRATK